MTTAATIIRRAFRENNLTAIGASPTDDENTEALETLNGFLGSLFGHEIPPRLRDWPIPFPLSNSDYLADYPLRPTYKRTLVNDPSEELRYLHPQSGARLVVSSTEGEDKTIFFPYDPWDGARIAFVDVGIDADITIDANKRLIDGQASIVISPPSSGRLEPRQWFYRSDLSEWRELTDVALESDMPLPKEFDDLFITGLAIRLSGPFRSELPETTVERYNTMLSKLHQRYQDRNPVAGDADEIPNSYQVGEDFARSYRSNNGYY